MQRPELATRVDRRITKISADWSVAASQYIESHLEAPAKAVFDHLLEQSRDQNEPALPFHRRTFERWYVRWRTQKGIPSAKKPRKLESYTFLRSAHQDCFDPGAFKKGSNIDADFPLILNIASCSSLRQRNRALFVLGTAYGVPASHISSYLMISQQTMGRWHKILKLGTVKQFLSPDAFVRNRPKLHSQNIREVLFKILHTPPKKYNFSRTNWRSVDLKRAMQMDGATTSLWTIRHIIRNEGYRWRKAKVSLTSTDPNYREKVDRIKEILANLQEDESFLSVDEYGPFSIRLVGGRKLVRAQEVPTVPQWQKSRGHLILTAALDLRTNQIAHFYSEKKNTAEMIKIIELVRKQSSGKSTLYFSWDAASWHMSKALESRLEFLNEWAIFDGAPKIILAPLPARAQFLNVIESVFSGMARALIHNSDFEDLGEAKKSIDAYIDQRNTHFLEHPKRAGNKIWGHERSPPVFNETNNHKDPRY